MTKPIAVQLYTVRDALAQDFEGVVRKIASYGYQGVEPFRNSLTTPQAAADLFKSLGLQVPSAHSPLPVGDDQASVLETMRLYGCKYLVCPSMPREQFKSVEGVKAVCKQLNDANQVARDAGLTLGYHNHWFEYEPCEGTYGYKIMAEHLDPTIVFEIDTYWAKVGGIDPVTAIKELGNRVPLLHVKDGPATSTEAPMVAVGEGSMDIPAILKAGTAAEWLVVELDRCATDMVTAVEASYRNLEGLARGN
jgi:sugar phosphate isomerase/epimerase